MVYHAWAGNRKTKGLVDYYVGGRSMGGVAIAISFFATYASTNSFLGFSGQAYTYGAAWLLLVPFAVVLSLASWLFVAPRLRDFAESLDSVTIPDFIGFRFGSKAARVQAAVIVIFASFIYMTAVFKGIGNLLEAVLDLPYGVSIFLVLIIVMVYTAVGGFHSVVKTDVVQGVLMIIAAVVLFVGITRAAGGVGSFAELRDDPATANLFTWNTEIPVAMLLGILFATTIKFVVEPRQLSRFYALRNRAEARKGVWVSTLIFLFVFALLAPIGIYAHNILPEGFADTDRIVPTLLSSGEVFNPAFSAFLFLAIISAAMSSLDSVLLVMASTFERDVTTLWRAARSERSTLRATRIYVAVFALIAAIIALNPPGGIVAMTSFSGSLYAACFLPALLLGLYWHKGNGYSVVASFATGILTLTLWNRLFPDSNIHRVFPSVVLSLTAYLAAASLTAANSSEEVVKFFEGKRS